MQVFDTQQTSYSSKGGNVIQVLNVSSKDVRLNSDGLYMNPGQFAVGSLNDAIERALRRGDLLEVSVAATIESEISDSSYTAQVAEPLVKRGRKPKGLLSDDSSNVEEDSEVAAEEEAF